VAECKCLACDHERTGAFKIRRLDDGGIIVFIRGGATFPSMPHYVEAKKVGKCTRDSR
jgi:hypothetical protein